MQVVQVLLLRICLMTNISISRLPPNLPNVSAPLHDAADLTFLPLKFRYFDTFTPVHNFTAAYIWHHLFARRLPALSYRVEKESAFGVHNLTGKLVKAILPFQSPSPCEKWPYFTRAES